MKNLTWSSLLFSSLISAQHTHFLSIFHSCKDSFPYESTALPLLAKLGSYTVKNHVYTQANIKEIIEYGRFRGVRIVPEFDTPGHTLSWGPGAGDGFLTQCYDDKEPKKGSFGPIDPTITKNYELMTTLFTELKTTFNDTFLHLGGDEVPFSCWKSNPQIVNWMTKNNIMTFPELESRWVQGMIDIAEKLDFNYVVWEEVFSNEVKVSKVVIYTFDPFQIKNLDFQNATKIKMLEFKRNINFQNSIFEQ